MSSAAVKFAFTAEHPSEMSVHQGSEVVLLGAPQPDGWVLCRTAGSAPVARQGLVPYSYLEMRPGASASSGSATRPVPVDPAAVRPSAPQAINVAVEHAECPVCYDEMHSRPVAVLKHNGKRVCRHFFHVECAQQMLASNLKECAVCRAKYSSVFAVPNYETNAKGWFEAVDFDGNGKLSRAEVLEILKAICPVDWRRLEARAGDLWTRWDVNGDGELSFEEICNARTGLLVYVKSTFKPAENKPAIPPALTLRTKREWFSYWDEDSNGTLEQVEVVRALIKTFALSFDLAKLEEMRSTVHAVWPLFDLDGSGEIDISEFESRDGLGDTIIASLTSLTQARP